MPIKINGATSGSTTITAPDSGSDETIELSTVLTGKADFSDWSTWTPTFNNFTLGNGTINVARFVVIADLVHAVFSVTLGSTSVMGTDPQISLPVTASSDYAANSSVLGQAIFNDTGVNQFSGAMRFASTTFSSIRYYDSSGSAVRPFPLSATAPFTWGSTDLFSGFVTYRAA